MSSNPVRKTRLVAVDPDQPDPRIIDDAAAILRHGGLVAFATETVYGLGAVATDPEAVARIFEAKGRPSFNPLIVHASSIEQARTLVDHWPIRAQKLAERFWPGPLTLVLPRSKLIPDIVTAGHSTVGIRIPSPGVARALIQTVGLPIAAPSANRSNRISPSRAEHVLADLAGRIDLILDGGPTSVGLESTVLDLTQERPRILRPGPISASMLEEALDYRPVELKKSEEVTTQLTSPGQLPVHYSPKTRAVRIEPGESVKSRLLSGHIAVLDLGHGNGNWPGAARVHLEDPEEAARQLYDILHRFDDLAPDLIVVLMPPDLPEWSAVRDRLERATVPFLS